MLLRLYLVLTCLVIGVAMNIGVAMWAAFKVPRPTGAAVANTSSAPSAITAWPGPVPSDWPATPMDNVPGAPTTSLDWMDKGPTLCHASNRWRSIETISVYRSTGGTFYIYDTELFGFPWRSLRRDRTDLLMMTGTGFFRQPVRGALGGVATHQEVAWYVDNFIPIVPLTAGFIGNTLLYASLPATLIVIPALLIRRRRAKVGECVKCRYPVTGLAICPECGTANPNRIAGSPVQGG